MSERVIKILMERDGNTREQAVARIIAARNEMEDCDYDAIECEDILQGDLGLEPDYIFDILL